MQPCKCTSVLLCVATLAGALGAQTFVDVTAAAGLAGPYMPTPGTGVPGTTKYQSAVAVGDFDGDGWDDLFWCGGGGQPARLFHNEQDGTFVDVAAAAGVDVKYSLSMPLWFDPDGDGDLDLLVLAYEMSQAFTVGMPGSQAVQHIFLPTGTMAKYAPLGPQLNSFRTFFFDNQGDGTFRERAAEVGLAAAGYTGAAAGDLDNDGDVDLVTTTFLGTIPSRFFRNRGDGTFREATPTNVTNLFTYGFAPHIVDMDNDGDSEVFWTGDFDTSKYLFNQGNWNFVDVTVPAGLGGDENGMGSAVGDVDNDGDLDWFISSIYHNGPFSGELAGWGTTGNRLYTKNNTNAFFTDKTTVSGVRDGAWGWGAVFADVDNDRDLDLFHTNGWYPPVQYPEYATDPLRAFINNGTGVFTEQAAALGLDDPYQGRGIAAFDYDHDGRLDLLVSNNDVGLVLYRNELDVAGRHWLEVELAGTGLNSQCLGARVTVSQPGGSQVRWIQASDNYMSQSPSRAWFGVGTATAVTVQVRWPGGQISTLNDVACDQRFVIQAP